MKEVVDKMSELKTSVCKNHVNIFFKIDTCS